MATFRTYDRLLFVQEEATEGTQATIAAADYVETVEPTFSITNRVFDRNVTRRSISPVPKVVTGTGASAGAPSAQCEFTFGVELAGLGTKTGVLPDLPNWDVLLRCCGMEHTEVTRIIKTGNLVDGGSAARVPMLLRNREALAEGTTANFAGETKIGRCVGDVHYNDPYVYYAAAGVSPVVFGTAAPKISGQATSLIAGAYTVSSAYAACGTDHSVVAPAPNGHAWVPADGVRLGGSGSTLAANSKSTCTIALELSSAGQRITAAGCRGSVEFVFTSGDRCIMQFTMTGKLRSYINSASSLIPGPVTQSIPPSIVGLNAAVQSSSYANAFGDAADITDTIFNTMGFNLGNEVTLRENVNDDVGYEASYITGRSSSFTINPDAIAHGSMPVGPMDWWTQLLSGDLTRMRFVISDDAANDDDANSFTFKMPAIQFDQVGDGDRDTVMAYDLSAQCTGGDNGSSVQEEVNDVKSTSSILNKRLGTNNEFVLYLT
jgi:hypothetical protein